MRRKKVVGATPSKDARQRLLCISLCLNRALGNRLPSALRANITRAATGHPWRPYGSWADPYACARCGHHYCHEKFRRVGHMWLDTCGHRRISQTTICCQCEHHKRQLCEPRSDAGKGVPPHTEAVKAENPPPENVEYKQVQMHDSPSAERQRMIEAGFVTPLQWIRKYGADELPINMPMYKWIVDTDYLTPDVADTTHRVVFVCLVLQRTLANVLQPEWRAIVTKFATGNPRSWSGEWEPEPSLPRRLAKTSAHAARAKQTDQGRTHTRWPRVTENPLTVTGRGRTETRAAMRPRRVVAEYTMTTYWTDAYGADHWPINVTMHKWMQNTT